MLTAAPPLRLPPLQDSLLAAPIILDLVILAELITRIELRRDGEPALHGFHPVAVLLSYLTKAPLVPQGTPVVSAARTRPAPPLPCGLGSCALSAAPTSPAPAWGQV
jgi:hypothetical protein